MPASETLNSSTSYYLRKILAEHRDVTDGAIGHEESIQHIDFHDLLNSLYQRILVEQKTKELIALVELHKQISSRYEYKPKDLMEIEKRILQILLGKDVHFESKNAFFGSSTSRRVSIQDLLRELNSAKACGANFLGPTLTYRYLVNSRRDDNWLKQFEIDRKLNISYGGSFFDLVDFYQQELFEQWIDDFITCCSKVIPDFKSLIERTDSNTYTSR